MSTRSFQLLILRPAILVPIVLLNFATGLVPGVWAAPGDPDTGFGTGGMVTTDFGGPFDWAEGVAIRNGKLAVVGMGGPSNRFAMAVYDSAGALDVTFSGDGKLIMDQTAPSGAVAWLPDGDLLIAPAWLGGAYGFMIGRLNPDGSYHSGFGTGGKTTIAVGSQPHVSGIAIQSDGKIILSGYSYFSDWQWAFVRFQANGALDTSFGGGLVTTDFGATSDDMCYAAALQADNKLVAAGTCQDASGNEQFTLARYTVAGVLDSTFGTGGKVVIPSGQIATYGAIYGLTIQPNGAILVCGHANGYAVVLRFTSSGTLDSTFGNAGRVVMPLVSGSNLLEDIVVDNNGRILVAGSMNVGADWRQVLVRLEPNGTMDGTFGSGGVVRPNYGTEWEDVYAVALPSTDSVLTVGSMGTVNVDSNFVVSRYRTEPVTGQFMVNIPPTVDGRGRSTNGGASFTLTEGATSIGVERRATYDDRGVIEFSLSSVPHAAQIVGADLTIDVSGLSYFPDESYPYFVAYGYSGNGALNATDPKMTTNQVGVSIFLTTQDVRTVTLTNVAYIQSLIAGSATHLGMVLYAGEVDCYAGFISKEGAATYSLPAPTLTLRYNMPPLSPADFDADGDVDLNDYQVWSACLQGPVIASGSGCAAKDLDADGNVDLADFARFQREF